MFVSPWSLWSLCPVKTPRLRAASLRGNRPRDGREKHWRGVESDIPGVNRVSRVLCYRGIANGSRDRACFRNELISRASNWLARGGDGMTQSKQRVFESSRLEEIKVERPFMPRSPISHTSVILIDQSSDPPLFHAKIRPAERRYNWPSKFGTGSAALSENLQGDGDSSDSVKATTH